MSSILLDQSIMLAMCQTELCLEMSAWQRTTVNKLILKAIDNKLNTQTLFYLMTWMLDIKQW